MHVKCSYFMSSCQTCDSSPSADVVCVFKPFHCYLLIFILLYIVISIKSIYIFRNDCIIHVCNYNHPLHATYDNLKGAGWPRSFLDYIIIIYWPSWEEDQELCLDIEKLSNLKAEIFSFRLPSIPVHTGRVQINRADYQFNFIP